MGQGSRVPGAADDSWSSRVRRAVRPGHVAACWAAFTGLQATLLASQLFGDRDPVPTVLGAVAVAVGLFLVAATSARFELREDALRTRSWLFRSDRPWSEVEAIEVDWRDAGAAPTATVRLTGGRTRQSSQWDRLADAGQAAERDELRRTLQRTAERAGVRTVVHDP